MRYKRLIPVLLLQKGNLVKGIKFKNHQYVGDPLNAVRIFNEKEVDELALLDISTKKEEEKLFFKNAEDIVSEAFMPISYGGGIQNLEQVKQLFKIGVEKVIINSAFYFDDKIIPCSSQIAGSQSIVVAVDVKKNLFGKYEVYTKNGTKATGISPVEYAEKAQVSGAGEILLTSIDREGVGEGLDLDLIKQVTAAVDIPVIAQGGVGSLDHIRQAVKATGVSAVAAGSFFTFYGKHKAVLLTYPAYHELGNLFFD